MKSLAAILRRRGGLILVVAIAAFAIFWFGRRNRPERLNSRELLASEAVPPESNYELSENPRTHTLNLAYRRFRGDSFLIVVSTPLPPELHYDPMFSHLLSVHGDLVYFTLIREIAQQKPPFGYGRVTRGRISLPPPKPIIRHFVIQPSNQEMHLCCLPLTGGAIKTLLTGKGVTSIAITDDTIYWISPRPEPATTIESREGMSQTITPTSLLMATSLKTLQTRRIADKMPMSVQFVPDHISIYWFISGNSSGQTPGMELWYYAPDLARPVHLTDNYSRGDANGDKPVVLGDRLYWLEDRIEEPHGVGVVANPQLVETSVVSIRQDGTQRRVILSMPIDASTYIQSSTNAGIAYSPGLVNIFWADRGRLFICLTESVSRPSEHRSTTTTCRLDPDSKEPLTRLLRLPDNANVLRFYKGYIYYFLPEEHSTLFGDERVISMAYYRWKVPD